MNLRIHMSIINFVNLTNPAHYSPKQVVVFLFVETMADPNYHFHLLHKDPAGIVFIYIFIPFIIDRNILEINYSK